MIKSSMGRARSETRKTVEEVIPEMTNEAEPGQGSERKRNRIKVDLLIHDLKVPLAVIEAGVLSLLTRTEKYGALTEKQVKVLTRALRNTKVTQTLVSDALELGRSRAGIMNICRCRLAELIEEALIEVFDLSSESLSDDIKTSADFPGLCRVLQGHGLYLKMAENLWRREVNIDPTKVRQILRNLLTNAMKYRKQRVELEVGESDGMLTLAVKDDGEGIPAPYHQQIFECYFQVDPHEGCPVRGHGLGLAGVMVLVEDMGGQLQLESDAGKGARFLVRIPLRPAA